MSSTSMIIDILFNIAIIVVIFIQMNKINKDKIVNGDMITIHRRSFDYLREFWIFLIIILGFSIAVKIISIFMGKPSWDPGF